METVMNQIISAIGSLDTKTIQLRALKLDRFITETLLPFLGFHGSMIATLILSQTDEPVFHVASILLPATAVVLIAYFRFRGDRLELADRTRYAAAIFCFLMVGILGLEVAGLSWPTPSAFVLVSGFLLVLCAIEARIFPAGALNAIGIYLALFLAVFWQEQGTLLPVIVYLICLVSALVYLAHRKDLSSAVGLLAGIAIVLFGEIDREDGPSAQIYLVLAVIVGAIIVYEVWARHGRQSDQRFFLVQGLVVVILGVSAFLVEPRDGEVGMSLRWLAAVVAYAVLMYFVRKGQGNPTRVCWVAIVAVFAVWMNFDPSDQVFHELWLPVLLTAAIVLGLVEFSGAIGNSFVRLVAAVMTAGLCFYLLLAVEDFSDRVLYEVRQFAPEGRSGLETLESGPDLVIDNEYALHQLSLLFLSAVGFLVAVFVSQGRSFEDGLPWWRGLIRDRHIVYLRRLYRLSVNAVKSIPIIGNILSVAQTVLTSLKYIKGDGSKLDAGDLLFGVANVLLVLSIIASMKAIFIADGLTAEGEISDKFNFVVTVASWAVWGSVIYLWGRLIGSLYYVLLGVAFIVCPIAFKDIRTLILDNESMAAIWVLACGVPLLFLSVFRTQTEPEEESTSGS
jgi:hypothetical protein